MRWPNGSPVAKIPRLRPSALISAASSHSILIPSSISMSRMAPEKPNELLPVAVRHVDNRT